MTDRYRKKPVEVRAWKIGFDGQEPDWVREEDGMKIKTSELTGPALDWAVAKCVGLGKLHYTDVVGRISTLKTAVKVWSMELPGDGHGDKFSPSTDWSQGGPIIEQERITVQFGPQWTAVHSKRLGRPSYGPTPLVAAMRCFVASRLGDKVDVPDELC